MSKVLAVASGDLCLGFSLTGVECIACIGKEDALAAIGNAIEDDEIGIVIVQAELLEGTDPRLRRDFGRRARPLIVLLPGELRWKDMEEKSRDDLVARLVRQAVGYKININR